MAGPKAWWTKVAPSLSEIRTSSEARARGGEDQQVDPSPQLCPDSSPVCLPSITSLEKEMSCVSLCSELCSESCECCGRKKAVGQGEEGEDGSSKDVFQLALAVQRGVS